MKSLCPVVSVAADYECCMYDVWCVTPALLKHEWGWGQWPAGRPDPGNQYPPYHWLLSFPSFVSVLLCGSGVFLLVFTFPIHIFAHFPQFWHICFQFYHISAPQCCGTEARLWRVEPGWQGLYWAGAIVLTYANGSSSVHNYSRNVAQRSNTWRCLVRAASLWHLIWNNYSYPGIFCSIAAGPDTLHATITPSSYKYTASNIQLNILQISSPPQQFPSLSDASEHLFYLRQQSIIRLPGAPIWEVFKRSMWNDKCRIVLWILNHFNRLVN